MQPHGNHGEGIKLETVGEVETVLAVIAAAVCRPHDKLNDPRLQRHYRVISGRFSPILLGAHLEMPQILSGGQRRAVELATAVAADHTAKAVETVEALAEANNVDRAEMASRLAAKAALFDNSPAFDTAMLATDVNIETVTGFSAALAELNNPQPPTVA